MMVTLTVSEIMFAYFHSGEKYAYEVIKSHDNYATRGALFNFMRLVMTGARLNLWGRGGTNVTY